MSAETSARRGLKGRAKTLLVVSHPTSVLFTPYHADRELDAVVDASNEMWAGHAPCIPSASTLKFCPVIAFRQ